MPYGMSPIAQPSPRGAGSYSPSSPGYSPTSPFIRSVWPNHEWQYDLTGVFGPTAPQPMAHRLRRLASVLRHLGLSRRLDTRRNRRVSEYRLQVPTSHQVLLNILLAPLPIHLPVLPDTGAKPGAPQALPIVLRKFEFCVFTVYTRSRVGYGFTRDRSPAGQYSPASPQYSVGSLHDVIMFSADHALMSCDHSRSLPLSRKSHMRRVRI